MPLSQLVKILRPLGLDRSEIGKLAELAQSVLLTSENIVLLKNLLTFINEYDISEEDAASLLSDMRTRLDDMDDLLANFQGALDVRYRIIYKMKKTQRVLYFIATIATSSITLFTGILI